jgi:hypothetical protein
MNILKIIQGLLSSKSLKMYCFEETLYLLYRGSKNLETDIRPVSNQVELTTSFFKKGGAPPPNQN